MRPSSVLFPLLMALALTVAACGRGGGSDRPPEPGDRAVAKIQDETIWASDVKREAVAQGLVGEGEPLDVSSDLFRRVLDEVIDQKLLAREAERRGLDNSPLAQRRLAATRERILGDILVETEVNGTINDRSVEDLYREQVRLAETSDEIRTRLILSRTRAEADAVMGILGQGATFEAVAMERSVDEATRFLGWRPRLFDAGCDAGSLSERDAGPPCRLDGRPVPDRGGMGCPADRGPPPRNPADPGSGPPPDCALPDL